MTMVCRHRRGGRSSILSCAAAIAAVSSAPNAFAFAPPPLPHDVRGGQQRRSFVPLPSRATTDPFSSSSAATAERPTTAVQDENDESAAAPPPLSETDARVLRSILSDENLDFKTEDNLKKLLERGVKSKESPSPSAGGGVAEEQDGGAADGKKKYASKTVEKLSSEGFWNSLQAKAEALLDSARLYVTNRIERDAKVLGAVGLFAWDRAKRDVARALPSVATRAKKVVRTLGEKSSFEDLAAAAAASREKEFGAGSEEREDGATEEAVGATTESEGTTTSVYEEFATPADELRSVSESIRGILSGSGDDVLSTGTGGSASGGTRGLRSVAPAGFANRSNRQQRAYRRRKETTLKREREGADKKIGRGVAQVADVAWEMKREMEIETNRAGYRTEGVRNAIEAGAATAARLAAGKGEGWGRRLSTGAVGRTLLGGDGAGTEVVEDVEPLEFKAASEGATTTTTTNRRVANEGIPTRRLAVVAEAVVEEPTVVVASVPPPPTEIPTVAELLNERARLASSLRLCLDAPDETWLIPDVVAASAEGRTSSVDDEALADAIALMIRARDEWEHREEEKFFVMDEEDVLEELARTKRTADEMAAAVTKAAGTGAARRFEEELYGRGGDGEEGRRSILFALDAREAGTATASAAAATNGADPTATESFAVDGRADGPVRTDVAAASVAVEEEEGAAAVVAPEVLDAVVVTSSSAVDAGAADDETLPYDPADYMIDVAAVDGADVDVFVPSEADRRAAPAAAAAPTAEHATVAAAPLAVEVLTSDEELEGTIFEAKAAVSVSEEEMAREEEDAKKPDEEDNVLVKAMLRALDVVFFVAEKTLTVALPGVLNAGGTFATRFEQVQRDGLGSKGWRRLTNARSGAKRY